MDTIGTRQIPERGAADGVEMVNAELVVARWEVDFLRKVAAHGAPDDARRSAHDVDRD
jgi:hypothetical protein